MRVILIRGKQEGNSAWIYGDLMQHGCDAFIAAERNSGRKVIPETVGQYIGLTDKKGNRIFEGDIIEMSDGKRFVVVYKAGGFDAAPIDWIGEFDKSLSYNTLGEVQNANCIKESGIVVGNIHDNPELLKGSAAK